MIDRSLIWTGDINERSIDEPSLRRRIRLYDTTLRDGEQTVGAVLTPEAKLEIALALDHLGVDRIEAGFPRVSEDDARAFELIVGAGLKAEIWGFSRGVMADVQALVDLGLKAAVIETPVSEGKLHALGVSHETLIERVVQSVKFATEHGIRVCYFGVDGTRAEPGFLEHVYRVAVDAGAQEIALVDTLGIAAPETVYRLVENARGWVGDGVPVHWHGHNDFGLATAGAIAAVRAGADWVHGTINGMGERAGNTDLGEFALAVEALYHGETGIHFQYIGEVSNLVQRLAGYRLAPWKPVTGENLFRRESGAVAAQFHEPQSIEPFSPELVGTRRGIVLGKKSGLASIKIKLEELGLEVPPERHPSLLAAVKKLGTESRRLVSDEEFRRLVGS
jgi:isopropylmalate/homocitrate/citramalate synthase